MLNDWKVVVHQRGHFAKASAHQFLHVLGSNRVDGRRSWQFNGEFVDS